MMQKHPITKYRTFPPINLPDRTWPNKVIETAPVWCSVDLRDGNQSLAIPMSVEEKIEWFKVLVDVGFKEIEVGFPSASDTEYEFCRALIDQNLIPEDVTIQCLVQCREHLIRKTFEAIEGAKSAIVHFYNSTNPLQRRVTFGLEKPDIKQIAIDSAKLIKTLAAEVKGTDIRFQYSPESFSDTEPDFAIEVCEAVMDEIQPTPENPIIFNLPATIEMATPNVHADQIEYFCKNIKNRESCIISLHTHNDRGTGIAATELGLMAGADRVEGTLFGNGERTGNVDIVTVALNMYSQGVHPQLDFSNLPALCKVYERCTRMEIPARHPYAGELVFTAFSGSHQDAIKKGMDKMDKKPGALWQVPYLPIDPEDLGRNYQAIIRINSQSGKGGVAYVLQHSFGFDMPKAMHPEIGMIATAEADKKGVELDPEEIKNVFFAEYINRDEPLVLDDYEVSAQKDKTAHKKVSIRAHVRYQGESVVIKGEGNGPINALSHAIESAGWKEFSVTDYRQHAIAGGSAADAATYLQIRRESDGKSFWGVSIETNIEHAGLKALVSAFNRAKNS